MVSDPSSSVVALWVRENDMVRALAALPAPGALANGLTLAICTYKRAPSLHRLFKSLAAQTRLPDEVIVVDASPDAETEAMLQAFTECAAVPLTYCRVTDHLRGLTRQRNVCLDLMNYDKVVFADDDLVLQPEFLAALETALNTHPEAVGVGGFFENEPRHPGFRLRMMRLLGGLSSLTPGAYCRSGITVPLRLLTPDSPLVAVDRLSGACMAWRGAIAREIRFEESFYGYAQSEDTLFSRLAASYGELLICPMAQCEHLQEASGRPDLVQQARMKIFNRYFIHQRVVPNRALRDVLWFFYANFLDIMLVSTALFLRGKLRSGFAYMYGSLLGLKDIYDTA